MNLNCPLCHNLSQLYFVDSQSSHDYYLCTNCDLRFLNPQLRLQPVEEKLRYQEHNNDIEDPRYQNFVRPLYEVIAAQKSKGSSGLDFGCGEGPVLAKIFQEANFNMTLYDHYFYPDTSWKNKNYDFIVASEVFEHLYFPQKEIQTLRERLNPEGILAIMTLMYDETISFENWFYRKDPTHVCFYSSKTCEWIKKYFSFTNLTIHSNRLIHFEIE